MLIVELLAQGLVQGSIYALIALGLTLVYGLLRILHVAHASLFTLGGYMGVLVTNQTGSLGAAL
ncbi:MAG: branched-chain amino acid ABC transporter permease, partial [Ramlibacter sp.]|nr:branched-chain amino acid ABC transporter permease [Ramlibacter sp.]